MGPVLRPKLGKKKGRNKKERGGPNAAGRNTCTAKVKQGRETTPAKNKDHQFVLKLFMGGRTLTYGRGTRGRQTFMVALQNHV